MIEIYADGATLSQIAEWGIDDVIRGFTTNPTLIRALGIQDYKSFCLGAMVAANNKPISFEVFADDDEGIAKQAAIISSWGPNVYVKVPIVNTKGENNSDLIRRLASQGIMINVTAVFTKAQVKDAIDALAEGPSSIVSIFAGRICDAGSDPRVPFDYFTQYNHWTHVKSLWASSRQVYDCIKAKEYGADIITLSPALIKKIELFGKPLFDFSVETVKMFYDDAKAAGFTIEE